MLTRGPVRSTMAPEAARYQPLWTCRPVNAFRNIAPHGMIARMTADPDHLAKRGAPAHLAKRRAAYAHEVLARYGTNDPAVEAAFAKVPREAFLGPPPWSFGSGGTASWATTSDPEALYQDRLVVLNRAKGINNGQPSLHAKCIAALHPVKPDHVLHLGAGTGYYTAILAELAGSVDAYEIDAALAAQAAGNLIAWPRRTRSMSAPGRRIPTRSGSMRCAMADGCCSRSPAMRGGAACYWWSGLRQVSPPASYRTAVSSIARACATRSRPLG